jgi:hypothetical protein
MFRENMSYICSFFCGTPFKKDRQLAINVYEVLLQGKRQMPAEDYVGT